MPEATQPPAGTAGQTTPSETPATPASFDEWIATQPEDIQVLYSTHTQGLKSSVQATRQEREALAKQLRDATAKLEKGSEAEKALADIGAKLEIAERRANFVEDAARPEIGCTNPRLAFMVAQQDNLFDRKGAPDWPAIKAAAPELFRATQRPPGNAGNGAGQEGAPAKNMNAFIRRAAGKS